MEESEELQTGVWYPREMFDRNPQNYTLVEKLVVQFDDCICEFIEASMKSDFIHCIQDDTTQFMYVNRPN